MRHLLLLLASSLLLLACADTSELDERISMLESEVENLRLESQFADDLIANLADQEHRKIQERVDTLCGHWQSLTYLDLPEELEGLEVWCSEGNWG